MPLLAGTPRAPSITALGVGAALRLTACMPPGKGVEARQRVPHALTLPPPPKHPPLQGSQRWAAHLLGAGAGVAAGRPHWQMVAMPSATRRTCEGRGSGYEHTPSYDLGPRGAPAAVEMSGDSALWRAQRTAQATNIHRNSSTGRHQEQLQCG